MSSVFLKSLMIGMDIALFIIFTNFFYALKASNIIIDLGIQMLEIDDDVLSPNSLSLFGTLGENSARASLQIG